MTSYEYLLYLIAVINLITLDYLNIESPGIRSGFIFC